jgi:hypothetical protein
MAPGCHVLQVGDDLGVLGMRQRRADDAGA